MASPTGAQAAASYRVLVYSEVTNSDHASIPAGIEAVRKLGAEHDFEVEATAGSSVLNDADLGRFQAVVFNNTNSTPETGDLLDSEELAALQRYVRAGGGWVGLHSASASERDWEWYEGLVGAIFDKHPTPADRPGQGPRPHAPFDAAPSRPLGTPGGVVQLARQPHVQGAHARPDQGA